MQLIFDKSNPDHRGIKLPAHDVPSAEKLEDKYLNTAPPKPSRSF